MIDKMIYRQKYKILKDLVEQKLDEYVPILYPEEIYKSMKYSLSAGGKRLRPVMTLEISRLISGSYEYAIPAACAIEMLHTQSLIHDDLPCMDNDDYRRGKPSNHKAFSESTAVLAGDALISYAIKVIIDKTPSSVPRDSLLNVINEFCKAAGTDGIIGGQIVDIASENKQIDAKTLDYIHEYKTAKMFILAIKAGAFLGGASEKQITILEDFASKFGHAFQIYDDILDQISTLEELGKTPGKDEKAHKATYTSLYVLQNAKNKVKELCNYCCDILINNKFDSEILQGIISDITERVC